MPLRPFPHQLSIGTDIASVNRIKNILTKGNGDKNLVYLVRRVLTRPERAQFWTRYGKFDIQTQAGVGPVSQFLAGRFAAKEATIKAVLWRRLSFHDVIIRTPAFGEQMSAVILDKPLRGDQPIQHEVELLKKSRDIALSARLENMQDALNSISSKVPEADEATTKAAAGGGPAADEMPDLEAAIDSPDSVGDEALSGSIAKISISHDGGYATAVCLAAEEPFEGDVGGEAAARGLDVGSR